MKISSPFTFSFSLSFSLSLSLRVLYDGAYSLSRARTSRHFEAKPGHWSGRKYVMAIEQVEVGTCDASMPTPTPTPTTSDPFCILFIFVKGSRLFGKSKFNVTDPKELNFTNCTTVKAFPNTT